jgi:hypothetical protein
MSLKKRVRIIKKIQESGNWKFISLKRAGSRFIWDDRSGVYYLEWWEGKWRCREAAGPTPSGALAAQRRKQNELLGAQFSRVAGEQASSKGVAGRDPADGGTPFAEAKRLFLAHVEAHSPDKPETVRRYRQVIEHFERHLAHGKYVEAISRADIDEYKIARCGEKSEQHDWQITASTVNFEVGTLRTFFYYLTNERGLQMENLCKKFKHLRDAKTKAGRRHPTYSQVESDAILAQCDPFEYAGEQPRRRKRARKLSTAPVPYPTIVLQGAEADVEDQDVCGDQRQCGQDADVDGSNRDAGAEVPPIEIEVRVVVVDPGRSAAAATVLLSRSVAGRPF